MLTKLLTRTGGFLPLLFLLLAWMPASLQAQDTLRPKRPDSLQLALPATDTAKRDSTTADTTLKSKKKKAALEATVDYSATDSIRFEIKNQRVFLYKAADLKYQDIELKADCVVIDFPLQTIHAAGLPDSTGKAAGFPEFKEGGETFKSKIMTYNYTSKKGYIQSVFTQQDEGYLHGTVVKKMENNVTYIRSGSYTTCNNEEHPHFDFKFNKAKVIPGKSIITGPAYMEIADVPTPLFIPFGYFPIRKGQHSGIILPSYGESQNRGFFLQDGGYYWAINEHMDLKILADVYSRGSWAVKPFFNYVSRYHYSGMMNLSYAHNKIGIPGTPGYSVGNDYRILWTHRQDKRARPRSTFSANVNIVSQNFNKYNPAVNPTSYLSNTFQSSINYATSFGSLTSLNVNAGHSQNTLDGNFTVTLPEIVFTVNQVYPFRKTGKVGKKNPLDQIGIRYNLDMKNVYNSYDSLLFKPGWTQDLQNGIQNKIPIGGTWNLLKFFHLSAAISMTDRVYFSYINKTYVPVTVVGTDTLPSRIVTDTIYGVRNAWDASLSTSLNTRLYGIYQFKGGLLKAVRHMMTPSVGFTYTPDFGAPFWGYWHTVSNLPSDTLLPKYSAFQGALYGGPPGTKSGVISMQLNNNLEAKVRNLKDTVTGVRKIMLIDNLSFNTSYDVARDSMNWSPLVIQARTLLFKVINLQYYSLWDPYARNEKGVRTSNTEWKTNNRLLRLETTRWNAGVVYTLTSDKVKKKNVPKNATQQQMTDIIDYYDNYVDFDIPWSFTVNYTVQISKDYNSQRMARVTSLVQTLGFNGQLNLTPKWKVTLMTGWDFTHHDLSYTRIDIYRDLHCWEMRFGWVPKGAQQSWNFSINVKASILQDMKLNKKKDFWDNQ